MCFFFCFFFLENFGSAIRLHPHLLIMKSEKSSDFPFLFSCRLPVIFYFMRQNIYYKMSLMRQNIAYKMSFGLLDLHILEIIFEEGYLVSPFFSNFEKILKFLLNSVWVFLFSKYNKYWISKIFLFDDLKIKTQLYSNFILRCRPPIAKQKFTIQQLEILDVFRQSFMT